MRPGRLFLLVEESPDPIDLEVGVAGGEAARVLVAGGGGEEGVRELGIFGKVHGLSIRMHNIIMSEVSAKVVVIGAVGVGKSSLTVRYVHQQFTAEMESTLGAVYFEKQLALHGQKIKF